MTIKNQTPGEPVDLGSLLIARDVEDVYSFLGVQAERIEIAQSREARSLVVPDWSDQDAYNKVMSGQRASLDDIKRYAERGAKFATDTLKKVEPQVRGVLCEDGKIRPEIDKMEDDVKILIGFLSGSIAGSLVAVIPPAAAGAVTSIATVLAIIIIKNQIEKFCQYGTEAIEKSQ